MSALDLAHHLRAQLEALGMTITEASARSGISRQTWHRLLQADIDEAKLSTCRVPWDHIPERSYPLFKARYILERLLSKHGYGVKHT